MDMQTLIKKNNEDGRLRLVENEDFLQLYDTILGKPVRTFNAKYATIQAIQDAAYQYRQSLSNGISFEKNPDGMRYAQCPMCCGAGIVSNLFTFRAGS